MQLLLATGEVVTCALQYDRLVKHHSPVAEAGHERAWGGADSSPCCFYHGWQPPFCKVHAT